MISEVLNFFLRIESEISFVFHLAKKNLIKSCLNNLLQLQIMLHNIEMILTKANV